MIDRKIREKNLDKLIQLGTIFEQKKRARADRLIKRYAKIMERAHNNGDIGGSYGYFLDFDFDHMSSRLLEIYGGAITLNTRYTGTEFKVTFYPTREYREEELLNV